MSQAGIALQSSGGTGFIETLTGNTGGAVGPDGADNINVVGSGSITIAGNAGTNTLTASLTTSTTPIAEVVIAGTSIANVTGDGTNYTVVFDAAILNIGSAFNTGTGVFTAPVAGSYMMASTLTLGGVDVAHTKGIMNLFHPFTGGTQGRNQYSVINPAAMQTSDNQVSISATSFYDLDVGDTIEVQIQVNGGAKTIDVLGDISGSYSWVSITLIAPKYL